MECVLFIETVCYYSSVGVLSTKLNSGNLVMSPPPNTLCTLLSSSWYCFSCSSVMSGSLPPVETQQKTLQPRIQQHLFLQGSYHTILTVKPSYHSFARGVGLWTHIYTATVREILHQHNTQFNWLLESNSTRPLCAHIQFREKCLESTNLTFEVDSYKRCVTSELGLPSTTTLT